MNRSPLCRQVSIGLLGALLGLSAARGQPAEPAEPAPPNDAAAIPKDADPAGGEAQPDARPAEQPAAPEAPAPKVEPPEPVPEGMVRLAFRGAPLDAVLEHLSRTLGFVIIKEAELAGTVDVYSHQPLDHEGAVELLNTVLNGKDLAAVQTDRTLRIVPLNLARMYDLPVHTGADPEEMPKGDRMVTQVIPIRYAEAAKLMENLQTLLDDSAMISANTSSNAILLTATQTTVRRMVTIIQALDTSISSVSEVRTFRLQYADAEELAEIIGDVFESPSESNSGSSRSSRMREFFMRMRGGGPPGMRGGSGGGSDGSSSADDPTGARAAGLRVKAVADTSTNAVVVNAPADMMENVAQLVAELDVPVEEAVSLKVFSLQYADAEDIAESINELFGNATSSRSNQRSGFFSRMMGPGGGSGGRQGGNQDQDNGELAEAEVTAVADERTNSVIVGASPNTLEMIGSVITQLDQTPKNVPQVYVYEIEHADLEKLQEMLEETFDDLESTSGTTGRTGTTNQTITNRGFRR